MVKWLPFVIFSKEPEYLIDFLCPYRPFRVLAKLVKYWKSIAIYFAWKGRSDSAENYLLNKGMSAWEAGISIGITYISSLTVIGAPADVYVYGNGFLWELVGIIFSVIILKIFSVPFSYKFQEPSIYSYLELRYNKNTFVMLGALGFSFFACCVHLMLLSYMTALSLSELSPYRIGLNTISLVQPDFRTNPWFYFFTKFLEISLFPAVKNMIFNYPTLGTWNKQITVYKVYIIYIFLEHRGIYPVYSLEECLAVVVLTAILVTVLGGMKAVIWTDCIQAGVVILGLATMAIKMWIDIGPSKIINDVSIAHANRHTDIFNISPTKRSSFAHFLSVFLAMNLNGFSQYNYQLRLNYYNFGPTSSPIY